MKTLALLLLSVASAAIAALSPIWQDDFDAPMRYEVHGPRCWTLGDGVASFGWVTPKPGSWPSRPRSAIV